MWKRPRNRSLIKNIRIHVIGLLIAAVFVLPLYWSIVASLRPVGAPPPQSVVWWPRDPQWQNYAQIFEIIPLWRYLTNSLLVVAAAVPITLLVSSLSGFAMAQLPGRRQRILVLVNIILLMVPAAALWLFRYQILAWLGLLSTLWALILPAFAAGNPLFVLLFYWSFQRVPHELYEAARLDGANLWQVWWYIGRGLARETAVAVIILSFTLYWSDFVGPVLYIFDAQKYTLPAGLQILNQLDATNWPLLMAAAVITMLPVLLLLAVLQRQLLSDDALSSWFGRKND